MSKSFIRIFFCITSQLVLKVQRLCDDVRQEGTAQNISIHLSLQLAVQNLYETVGESHLMGKPCSADRFSNRYFVNVDRFSDRYFDNVPR